MQTVRYIAHENAAAENLAAWSGVSALARGSGAVPKMKKLNPLNLDDPKKVGFLGSCVVASHLLIRVVRI